MDSWVSLLAWLTINNSPNLSSVLPPIPTNGLSPADVDSLVQQTREQMMSALVDLYTTKDEYAASVTGKAKAN